MLFKNHSQCKGRAAHRSLRRLDVRIVAPRAGAAVSADAAAVVGPRDRRHGLEAVEEGVVVQAVHLLVEGVLRQRDEWSCGSAKQYEESLCSAPAGSRNRCTPPG